MNRRRNKVDMEKVFATVISLAIMIALVVGVTSILKSNNNKKSDDQKNYIDLNEINEVVSDDDPANATQNQAANEPASDMEDAKGNGDETETTRVQTANNGEDGTTGKNDQKDDGKTSSEITGEADKTADQDTEVPDTGDDVKSAEGDSRDGDQNVSANTGNEGTEVAEGTGTQPEDGNTQVADNQTVNGEAGENGDPLSGDELAQGTDNPAGDNNGAEQGEVPAGENLSGSATPVSASTATLLGYHFSTDSTLMWPTQGNVILNYNMTNTIYFPTLDVYKCNPAIVISASEGSVVTAAADGIVMAVYETKETGLTLELAIGDDYVLTYGQLKDLVVGVGSQVSRGDVLGAVAAPSQYYTVEGDNLYFRVDDAEGPVNPMDFIDGE